jgi:RimJ/RimL family protein N-acetyltransferase
VTANNLAAIRLYKSFGFLHEGIKRHAVKKDDGYLDVHVMGLLKTQSA